MRSAFFAGWVGLLAFGCTADTHGTGQSGLGSAGDTAGSGSGTAAGGSSASGGSNGSGTGGVATVSGKTCGKIWYNGESGPGDVNLASATTWTDPSKDPSQ